MEDRHARFGALATRTIEVMHRVGKKEPLLVYCTLLLEADAAVLIQLDGEDRHILYHYASEQAHGDWLRGFLPWLSWIDPILAQPRQLPGVLADAELEPWRSYADNLVAFGSDIPCKHVLVVLRPHREGAERYTSYHLTVASALLRNYEAVQREIAAYETRGIYAAQLNTNVLPSEPWQNFVDRASKQQHPAFFYVNAVVYVGYRQRMGQSAIDAQAWIEDQRYPADSHLTNLCRLALKFFRIPRDGDISGVSTLDLAERLNLADVGEVCRIAREWCRGGSMLHPGFDGENELADGVRVLSLVAETLCKEIRQQLMSRHVPRHAGLGGLLDLSCQTMDLMAELGACLLRRRGGYAREPQSAENAAFVGEHGPYGKGDIGREILHLHFIVRLAESAKLRTRYLARTETGISVIASDSLKRAFILSLTRYWLWAISLVQRRFDIRPDDKSVSTSELFDALIHLVDRYAHVELGVDECLDLRRNLLKGAAPDIQNNTTARFYRDHLTHVIDVFLLGDIILRTHCTWSDETSEPLAVHLHQLRQGANAVSSVPGDVWPKDGKSWHACWAVASLLHDIGYHHSALCRIPRADRNGAEPAWMRYWDLSSRRWQEWKQAHMAGEQRGDIDAASRAFAQKLAEDLDGDMDWLRLLADTDGHVDHGVLAALRLAQISKYAEQPSEDAGEESPIRNRLLPAIHAIAYHNLADREVQISESPLSCLMRLCDELQDWGRKRVNLEKTVRRLQVDLLDLPDPNGALPCHDMLERLHANIYFVPAPSGGERLQIQLDSNHETPHFNFQMYYADAVIGQFDATLTLLSKAYKLQHVDLSSAADRPLQRGLCWSIELCFRTPQEYHGLTEYDIYSLFAEHTRAFPLLTGERHSNGSIGLTRLQPDGAFRDRFRITLSGAARSKFRQGWFTQDPRGVFAEFAAFKERILVGGG